MRASLHGARRVTQALDWTLEVLPARTSKAEGLRRLLEHLQINPRRVMAVGDGENDIEGVGVPAPVQGRAPVPGRSAMDGVGEKAPPPSVSVGERGSKKMCRFGVSGVAAPM